MHKEKLKIVASCLGEYRIAGDETLFYCPFCKHHKHKLSVNVRANVYKCWICDERGKNIYRMVRKFGSYKQRERYRQLQGLIDLTDFEQIFKEYNDIEDKQILELPKEFVSLCNKDLPMHATEPFRYLASRGLGRKEILKWKIGYCKEGRYGGLSLIHI